MASISKRVSGAWQNTSYGIRATATDTIATLPTTIYGDGTNATVSVYGNTTQNGTPTPDNPIMPQGCGVLETSSEHSGQYKIPISSANTTTNVYLGEVESTRKIKKLVLTGEENWGKDLNLDDLDDYFYTDRISGVSVFIAPISSHFISGGRGVINSVWTTGTAAAPRIVLEIGKSYTGIVSTDDKQVRITKFKSYLATQYANGTPVTIWYVLAEPETAVVNEPLMKIDGYADEVNNISIPTTDGANTLSVDTTVQPSEVSVNYHGWHMGAVHERNSGQWD